MTAADREARFRELVARQVSAANRAAHARERAVLALEQVALTHETHAEVVRSTAATVADARRHRQRSEELRTSAERALARISRQRPVAKRINGRTSPASPGGAGLVSRSPGADDAPAPPQG